MVEAHDREACPGCTERLSVEGQHLQLDIGQLGGIGQVKNSLAAIKPDARRAPSPLRFPLA